MAATYNLISSQVLGSSTASVTFSSIPQTYTDLVIRASIRTDYASAIDSITINFNNVATSVYSWTGLRSSNTSAQTWEYPNQTEIDWLVTASTGLTNTFAPCEIYIPSYTLSQNKPFSVTAMQENNLANTYSNQALAGLYSQTTAITSIKLAAPNGNIVANSSFYLYGLKSS